MFSGVIASFGSGRDPPPAPREEEADCGGIERTDPVLVVATVPVPEVVPRDTGRDGLAPTLECRLFDDDRAGRCVSASVCACACSSTFESRVDREGGSGGVFACEGDSPPPPLPPQSEDWEPLAERLGVSGRTGYPGSGGGNASWR